MVSDGRLRVTPSTWRSHVLANQNDRPPLILSRGTGLLEAAHESVVAVNTAATATIRTAGVMRVSRLKMMRCRTPSYRWLAGGSMRGLTAHAGARRLRWWIDREVVVAEDIDEFTNRVANRVACPSPGTIYPHDILIPSSHSVIVRVPAGQQSGSLIEFDGY
jgi:hypothetical protein